MKQMIKKIPYTKLAHSFFKNCFALYATKSYSQEGEDLILKRVFEKQEKGFYVDIGAHHPFRFSNTYFFYKKGWRGINIDAMPNSMKLFNRFRPKDTNLQIPIGKDGEILEYFSFNEPALNTFQKDLAMHYLKNPKCKLLKTYSMQISSLVKILEKHLPMGQKIDFMSIDVEGLDFQVLQSNDWQKYRPRILLVEALGGGGYGRYSLFTSLCFFIQSKLQIFCQNFQHSLFPRQGV